MSLRLVWPKIEPGTTHLSLTCLSLVLFLIIWLSVKISKCYYALIQGWGLVDGQHVNILVLLHVGHEEYRRLGQPKDGYQFKDTRWPSFFEVRKDRGNTSIKDVVPQPRATLPYARFKSFSKSPRPRSWTTLYDLCSHKSLFYLIIG